MKHHGFGCAEIIVVFATLIAAVVLLKPQLVSAVYDLLVEFNSK